MAEEKVVEQKQEHVSENPEIKDTEHVESSEVPPEAMSEGIVVDPATKEENEITPHEKSVEEVTAEANRLMQLQKKQMGDENSSVYIDMSKIVMDKDGIPEFTHEDAIKLKDSDIVLTDFEYEIRESRNIIKAIRFLLIAIPTCNKKILPAIFFFGTIISTLQMLHLKIGRTLAFTEITLVILVGENCGLHRIRPIPLLS